MTTVINIRRKKGQPMPHYDALIDRRTVFGNPYQIGADGDRELVLSKFRTYFNRRLTDPTFRDKVLSLKGKVLGCWCKPLACHGDVIVEYLEHETLPQEHTDN